MRSGRGAEREEAGPPVPDAWRKTGSLPPPQLEVTNPAKRKGKINMLCAKKITLLTDQIFYTLMNCSAAFSSSKHRLRLLFYFLFISQKRSTCLVFLTNTNNFNWKIWFCVLITSDHKAPYRTPKGITAFVNSSGLWLLNRTPRWGRVRTGLASYAVL